MENKNEIWHELLGFGGKYLIDNKGNVKTSETTSLICGRKPSGKILKKVIGRSGYYTIYLRKDKKQNGYFQHRLIAKQFIENPLNKPNVNHKDSNRLNNELSNLEWVTMSENNSHAHKFGGQKIYVGEKHSQNILTEKEVLEIRRDFVKHKNTMVMLAEKYSCSKGAIQAVLSRKTWKHI